MENSVTHKSQGHRKRLRERFLDSGLSGFQDYEVIELLLTLATPRKDCKEAAKAVLKQFKTLQGVFEASSYELSKIDGIGPSNQLGLRLIKETAVRYLGSSLINQDPIKHSKDLINYLNMAIRDRTRECFVAVFLNAKNKVIASETLSTGTLTASSVYPREVVQSALDHKAAAVIFAHNHPSGDPTPSPEDISITRQLVFALKLMEITVHEHLVIGAGGHFSFAESGYIALFKQEFNEKHKVCEP
ncbi:MAG: DNA repair protein RadC [Proteobacteria bacterium]|nr:DNA repair protein RadC [Pseudomonadota bacterium]